jgi:hypothetical protein
MNFCHRKSVGFKNWTTAWTWFFDYCSGQVAMFIWLVYTISYR